MDSWLATLRLVLVMVAIGVSYFVGRWAAETLQGLVASGALPTL